MRNVMQLKIFVGALLIMFSAARCNSSDGNNKTTADKTTKEALIKEAYKLVDNMPLEELKQSYTIPEKNISEDERRGRVKGLITERLKSREGKKVHDLKKDKEKIKNDLKKKKKAGNLNILQLQKVMIKIIDEIIEEKAKKEKTQ